MNYCAGLDVSVKATSVCIVDDTGRITRDPVYLAANPIPLNSVRRTSHQQFGRIKKVRGGGCYSVSVRQDKDDFIVRLHDVVTIVLCFRDYDGARQIEARFFDPVRGVGDGGFRRDVRLAIPVQ
jgi:hypothetical protein